MLRIRHIVIWSLAVCATFAIAGCSSSGNSLTPTSTSTDAAPKFDLSRISEIESDMPPGFDAAKSVEVEKLHPAYVASVGAVLSSGDPYTVDPPQCSVLLKPVDGVAESDSIGFRADGADRHAIAVGAYVPVNVPSQLPATGCDKMTYTVPDDDHPRTGTVERVAAPTIDGATTLGMKIATDGFPDPEYYYAAIIDDRVFVNVNARLAQDMQAQPLLPDLLVRTVNAIRG